MSQRKRFQLRTGFVRAAGYANKLRRVALAVMSREVPRDVIVRDTAEFNRRLYEKMVKEIGLRREEVVRINVEAEYDPDEKRIIFREPQIERYVRLEEAEAPADTRKLEEEVNRLKTERDECMKKLEELRERLEQLRTLLKGS